MLTFGRRTRSIAWHFPVSPSNEAYFDEEFGGDFIKASPLGDD
jgi:hypothetical protein